MCIDLCYIKSKYFIDNQNFVKMLDKGNTTKQSKRGYICFRLVYNNVCFYIPLRNNLGDEVRKYGRIGHSIPSHNRPKAGLDYRYALVINDNSYIEHPQHQTIPNIQLNKITNDYNVICKEFSVYIRGFIKAANKGRIQKEPLYRESSLINYTDILIEQKQPVAV